jgi:plastocyanin
MEDMMNLFFTTHRLVIPVLGMILITGGCASTSNPGTGTKIHTVNVGQKIEPLQINAGKGDEVRWVNQRSEPIAVMFPASDTFRISCRTGFKSLTQTVLSAIVPPNGSASLCFSEPGKYNYDVRLDENIAAAAVDKLASVWIVGRGSRNPTAAEAYENITP